MKFYNHLYANIQTCNIGAAYGNDKNKNLEWQMTLGQTDP